MGAALVNGKRVDFHVVDLAGSVGVDVTTTAPSYMQRGRDEARLISECEFGQHNKNA